MAHARNARAAPRALASSDIASRRRTTRSRLYGNRGPGYVRANSAASSRVRTATTGVSRMGGWNTKSVMSPKLLVVDLNKQPGASPFDRATPPISLLYHYYTTNTTTIPQISLLYHSIIIPQFFCAGPSSPSAMAHAQKRSRSATRAGLVVSEFAPYSRLGLRSGYGIAAARQVQLSAGCPDLARRLSGPALERMRECAHLVKTK